VPPGWTGDGAAGKQVSRPEIAAIRGVVGEHLRKRPIQVAEISPADAMPGATRLSHRRRLQTDLRRQIEAAVLLVIQVRKIRQWLRVSRWARRGRNTKRSQRFGGDDPGRNTGSKTFCQKRTERLVLQD